MLNWAIYSFNAHRSQSRTNESDTCSANSQPDGKSLAIEFISVTELAVPMSLSLLLSLIHSQIVATSSANLVTPGAHKGPVQSHRKKRERKKRRKSTRSRSLLNIHASETKSRTNSLTEEKEAIEANVQITRRLNSQQPQQQSQQQQAQSQAQQQQPQQLPLKNATNESNGGSPPRLRKRNVNWRSPIKSNSCTPDIKAVLHFDEFEKDKIHAEQRDINNTGNENGTAGAAAADDDGFESLNGKSSSGEEMSAMQNGQPNELNAADIESAAIRNNNSNNTSNSSNSSSNQQYVNSAYLMGSFDDNVGNENDSDKKLLNGTNGISENVSGRDPVRDIFFLNK